MHIQKQRSQGNYVLYVVHAQTVKDRANWEDMERAAVFC
jgi:hypothetical protein